MGKDLLRFRVKRFNRDRIPSQWIQEFQVVPRKGMNLLEALLSIQEEQDGSLGFRYSCRGAVCGSCGMKVNGKSVLACRTILEKFKITTFFIEPLPNFSIIYDLIVDMSVLFEHNQKIEPYLSEKLNQISENIMREEMRRVIDPYIQCIHCGICYATCPAFGRNRKFLGPAILAKVYRFFADPRNKRYREMLYKVNDINGVWGCNTVFKCEGVCPKGVPPAHGILKLREGILRDRFLRAKGFLEKGINKYLLLQKT